MFVLLFAFLFALPSAEQDQTPAEMTPTSGALLEIRSYNLKRGERERFHELFIRESLPLLQRADVEVVGYGPSLHDGDSYFLMRAFTSLEARDRQEEAFYSSPEWRNGPRAAVLAAIDSYTTVVVRVERSTLEGLRRNMSTFARPADIEILVRLNQDYINAVKTSDIARFEEILAPDFLCSLPDGSLIDRVKFLEQAAKPYTLGNLEAHDVTVRVIGDIAIVHARTTFTVPGGAPGSGRYTDVWARRDGRWLAVAAHVTRK